MYIFDRFLDYDEKLALIFDTVRSLYVPVEMRVICRDVRKGTFIAGITCDRTSGAIGIINKYLDHDVIDGTKFICLPFGDDLEAEIIDGVLHADLGDYEYIDIESTPDNPIVAWSFCYAQYLEGSITSCIIARVKYSDCVVDYRYTNEGKEWFLIDKRCILSRNN